MQIRPDLTFNFWQDGSGKWFCNRVHAGEESKTFGPFFSKMQAYEVLKKDTLGRIDD